MRHTRVLRRLFSKPPGVTQVGCGSLLHHSRLHPQSRQARSMLLLPEMMTDSSIFPLSTRAR